MADPLDTLDPETQAPDQFDEPAPEPNLSPVQRESRDRRENRLRAEDLSSRGIPTYRNASGDVSELTDEAGGALTHYDRGHGIAYDSKGQPKLISYDSATGPPTLKDPFADLPSRTDEQGNIYKKGHGLTQYTGGVDPVISAQYQQDQADKQLAQQATLMGRKNTLDQAELVHGQQEHKKLADDLRGAIPALNAPDAQTDLDSVHKAIDEHFDTQYADPAANETAGWFGKGLTPEAQKLREGIDARKEEAHQAADRLAELGDHLGGIQQSIEENRSQEQLIVEQQLAHSRGQPGPLDAPQGDYGAGNIDLTQRPVVRNDDGSISTEKSKSFSMDGKEVLIPTVAADGSGVLSDAEAIAQYKQTGQFLGKFDTPEQADAYAQELHNVQQERYAGAAPTKPQLYPPLKDWARMGVQPDRAPEAAMRSVESGEVPEVAAPAVVAASHDAADAIKKADDLKESNPTLSDQFRAAGHGILKGLADGVAELVKSPIGQAVIADYQISPVGIMSRGLPTTEGPETPTAIAARSAEAIKAMGPKADKALEGTVGGKIGNFAGNVLPYMLGALTGPAAPYVDATLFFSSSYQSTYDDAKAHGASENKAHGAAITVGAINAALALPLKAVSGAAKAVFGADTPGVITQAIKNAYDHGGAEAVGSLLGKLKGVIESGEKPIIEGAAVDVKAQAVKGIDAVLEEIRKTPGERLASVAKTAAGGAAVGAGVTTASNLVRKSYNPDQGTFDGVAENAIGFGVLAGASKGFEQVLKARQAKQALDVISKGGGPGKAPQIGGPNIPPEPGKGPGPGGTTPGAPKPPKPEPPGEKPVTGKVIEPEPPTGGKPKGGAPSETGIGRTQPPEPTTEKPAPTEGPPAPKPSDEAGAVGEPSGAEPATVETGADDVLARLKTAETDYIAHGGHADKLDAQNKLAKITEAFPDPAARLAHLESLKAPEAPEGTVTPPTRTAVKVSGTELTISHEAGAIRKEGHEPLGTDYGTVKDVKGADGMNLDAVIKPGAKIKADNPIFVVNQHGADGSFDEHKAVFGAKTPEEATALYKSNFPKDFTGVSAGSVVKFSPKEFKAWTESGAPAKKEPAVAPGEVGPTPGTAESIKKLGPDADRVAALDAVKAGTKPVTILSGPAEDFVAEAKERGLRVTKFTDPASGKEVSVAHANNPKAVKALIDAYKSTAPNRHELLGQALGFRPEEIADFISKQPKKEEKPLTKEEAFTGLEKASERLEEIDRGGVGTHAKTETERQEVISEIQRFREATHEHEPETVIRIPHPKYPKGVPAMEVQVLKVADGFWMERHSISVGKGGMGGPLHGHYATKEAALAAAYASLMRFASKAQPSSSEKKVFNDIQKALAELHEAAKAKVEGAGPAPDAISPSEYPAKALKKHVDDWAKDRATDLERLGAKINGTSYGPDEVGPAGIVFKTGTGEIAYNLQKLAQDFANGRLPHVMVGPIMTARMNEEFAHATDVHTQGPHEDGTLALRRRWTAFYGALSPEAHTAIKLAFHGNEAEGDPAILAAEYIARLFMRRHGLKMAEEFFPEPQKRDVASLLAILDAEQPPVIEAHLQAMEAALKAPEAVPEPEPTPEPTPPAPTPEPAKTDLDNQMDELMGDLLGGEGPPPAPEPTPEPPKPKPKAEVPVTDGTMVTLSTAKGEDIAKALGLEFAGIQKGVTVGDKSLPGHLGFHVPRKDGGKDYVTVDEGETVGRLKEKVAATQAAAELPTPEGEPPVPTPKPKPKPKADKGKVKLSDEEQKLIDDAIGGLFATPLTAFKTEQKGIDMDRVEKFAKLAGMMLDKGITTPQAAADFMRSNIGHQMLPYAQALWDAMALEKPELYGTHEWDPLFAQTAPAEEEKPKAEPPTGGKKRKAQVPVEKIEDFGEKIGGARKDLWRKRGLALDDLEQMNDAEREVLTTRDNVWPTPDYEGLIKDGMPATVAMLVRDARSTLAKNPNFQSYYWGDKGTTETAKVYVNVISDLRERMEKVRTIADIQAAWQTVLKSQEGKTGAEIKSLIARKNGYPKFSPSEYDEIRAKKVIEETGWPKPQEGWERQFEIKHSKAGNKVWRGGTYVTLGKDEFFVVKPSSGRIVSPEPGFATREEAVAWAQANAKGGGTRITRPIKSDSARTGPDYREGRNVTGEEILETFGFRGGEFGNWTNQADRQQSLNQAYDALKDLARVLRVPDKAVSLNGEMAIAFGARGHGKASAHYEPLRIVINLTKMSGAGALAHEWAHAVDDYFRRIAMRKIGTYASHGEMVAHVRPEVISAWADVMTALTKKKADQTIIVAEAELKLNNIRKRIDEWIRDRAVKMAKLGNVTADERFQSLMAQLRLEEPREDVDLPAGYNKYDETERQLVGKIQNLLRETPGAPSQLDRKDAEGLANNAFWASKYYAQLQSAIAGEVTRFDPTQFYKNALAADKGRKEYWSELHEIFARAFESYAQRKIAAEGNTSDYLVHSVKGGAEGWAALYPMSPESDEMDKQFDALWSTIKHEETEKGVRLYATPVAEQQVPIPREKLAGFLRVAESLIKAGINTPKGLSDYMEERYQGRARQYYQAIWNTLGMVRPELRGIHDWVALRAPAPEPEPPATEEPPTPAVEPRSWKVEVKTADDPDKWVGNGLRFPSEKSAQVHADDLFSRWMSATASQVVPSEDEPNRNEAGESLDTEPKPDESAAETIAAFVRDKIDKAERFGSAELFAAADKAYRGTQAAATYTPKDAYDAMELGVNQWILEHAIKPEGSVEEARDKVKALERIISLLPTQTKRTEEQQDFQQFSTPPPFAFAANWVANVTPSDLYAETSAGIGGLAVFGKTAGATVLVNELSDRRAELLRKIFPEVSELDAELWPAINHTVHPTVAVLNPAFSATAGRTATNKTMHGAKQLEVMLDALAPGGRLVAIVGEGMGAMRPAFLDWWKKIAENYTVRANIPVSGDAYKKYGTSFDNQLLVIDKPLAGEKPEEYAPLTQKVESYADLIPILAGVRTLRGNAGTGAGSSQPEGGGTPAGGGTGATTVPGTTAPPTDEVGTGTGTEPPRGGRPRGDRGSTKPKGGAGDVEGRGPGSVGDDLGGRTPEGGSERPRSLTDNDLVVGQKEKAEDEQVLTEAVFVEYKPAKLSIEGAKPHPTPLVESAAMAAVQPPNPTYKPKISQEIIKTGALSEAQLEPVVYSGQANEQLLPDGKTRKGYMVGDGTGVGKGRIGAGIILDNFNHARPRAVWLTEKKSLIKAARRDLDDLGLKDAVLEDLGKTAAFSGSVKTMKGKKVLFSTYDTLKGGSQLAGTPPEYRQTAVVRVRSENMNGTVVKSRTSKGRSVMSIKMADGRVLKDVNQGDVEPVKPAIGQKSRLDQLVEWFGPDYDGVIIIDESHNAANSIGDKASQKAQAILALDERLPNARIIYMSATAATEVSNFAYANRLGLWGPGAFFPDKIDFINKIEAAGLSAMEIIARDLKTLGLFNARTLSFGPVNPDNPEDRGVEFDILQHDLTPEQTVIYDKLANGWQIVFKNLQQVLESTGAGKNSNAKKNARGAFFSAVQRFFNQTLTAITVPTLLADMKKELAAGHSVILQLVNTNEAAQERGLLQAADEETELDEVDLSPKAILLQYLQKAFPTALFQPVADSSGKETWVQVIGPDGLPVQDPAAIRKRDALIDSIATMPVPENPMEQILKEFGHENVAEVTGRKRRLIQKEVDGKMETVIDKRSESIIAQEVQDFHDLLRRILIFSDKGGTGESYHAGRNFKNQQRRIHYLVQAGWIASKAMQGLGRGHRSNQVVPPHIKLLRTNLDAHKRFISTIAKRLSSLGAISAGERRSTGQGLFSPTDNLETEYSLAALHAIIKEAFDGKVEGALPWDLFTDKLGFDNLVEKANNKLREAQLPKVPQFLNRLLSLTFEEGNAVFSRFFSRMEENIQKALDEGTYDPGLQLLDPGEGGSIEKQNDEIVYTHEGSGGQTRLVQVQVNSKAQFNDWAELINRYGREPDKVIENKRSGYLFAIYKAGNTTDRATGAVVPSVRKVSIKHSEIIPAREIEDSPTFAIAAIPYTTQIPPGVERGIHPGDTVETGDGRSMVVLKTDPTGSLLVDREQEPIPVNDVIKIIPGKRREGKFEEIPLADAPEQWAAQIAESDPMHREKKTFLVGLFLPIWNRLKMEKPRVFQFKTTDRERMLGILIPPKSVTDIRKKLSLGIAPKSPQEVVDGILNDGMVYQLANGWRLRRARVNQEQRIELVVPLGSPMSVQTRLEDMGLFIERIQFKPRYFVPVGDKAPGIIKEILEGNPITSEGEAGETLGATPLPILKPLWDKTVKPLLVGSKEGISELTHRLTRVIAPSTGTLPAAQDELMKMLGGQNQAAYILAKTLKVFEVAMSKMTRAQQVDFVDKYKAGAHQTIPELDALDALLRALDNQNRDLANKAGEDLGIDEMVAWKDNHFRVMWKVVPGQTRPTNAPGGAGRKPLRGSRGMLRESTLDSMSEGIARGGEPFSWNPVTNFKQAQADIMKLTHALRVWKWAKDTKHVVFVKGKFAKAPPGYVALNDAISKVYFPAKSGEGLVEPGQYFVEENFGRQLNNYLSRDLVRESSFGRGLLWLKNATTAIELALSVFHGVFETGEAVGSNIGLGLSQLVNRGLLKGDTSAAFEGIMTMLKSPARWITGLTLGNLIREAAGAKDLNAYFASKNGQKLAKMFPRAPEYLKYLFEGGWKPTEVEADWKNNSIRAFTEALAEARSGKASEANYIGAMLRAFPALNEFMMIPLFDKYIPSLKVAQFFREIEEEIKTNDLKYNHVRKDGSRGYLDRRGKWWPRPTNTELARKVWRLVEDRFGELNYDTLFWNRTFKSAMQIMFRSVTWKLGSVEAFAGAFHGQGKEFIDAIKERRAPQLHRNMAWLLGMLILTAALGTILSEVLGGRKPKSLTDLVFPQIDPKDPQVRVSLPTYFKDLVHLIHSPTGYVTSSMSGWISRVMDLLSNKDYFGVQIRDTDAPLAKQAMQVGDYAAQTLLPFSIRGYKNLSANEVSTLRKSLALLGVNPAPRYISQSKAEGDVEEFWKGQQTEAGVRPQQFEASKAKRALVAQIKHGEKPNLSKALAAGTIAPRDVKALYQRAHMGALASGINHMPLWAAEKVYRDATPTEKAQIEGIMMRKRKGSLARSGRSIFTGFD